MAKVIEVYCDESRQTNERFMVLGGIAVAQETVRIFDASIAKCRKEKHMGAEFKWNAVRSRRLEAYKAFLDCFFALTNTDRAHFHAIIIDSHQVDHARFGCDPETGFYKFYYQLLLHCFGKKYCLKFPDNRLLVYTDYRTSSYSLPRLRDILNAGMMKNFAVTTAPFRSVQPRDSACCPSIQVVDVLIGAIGYKKNGYDLLAGANPAKIELVKYITAKSGLRDITASTPRGLERFAIWNFRLQK